MMTYKTNVGKEELKSTGAPEPDYQKDDFVLYQQQLARVTKVISDTPRGSEDPKTLVKTKDNLKIHISYWRDGKHVKPGGASQQREAVGSEAEEDDHWFSQSEGMRMHPKLPPVRVATQAPRGCHKFYRRTEPKWKHNGRDANIRGIRARAEELKKLRVQRLARMRKELEKLPGLPSEADGRMLLQGKTAAELEKFVEWRTKNRSYRIKGSHGIDGEYTCAFKIEQAAGEQGGGQPSPVFLKVNPHTDVALIMLKESRLLYWRQGANGGEWVVTQTFADLLKAKEEKAAEAESDDNAAVEVSVEATEAAAQTQDAEARLAGGRETEKAAEPEKKEGESDEEAHFRAWRELLNDDAAVSASVKAPCGWVSVDDGGPPSAGWTELRESGREGSAGTLLVEALDTTTMQSFKQWYREEKWATAAPVQKTLEKRSAGPLRLSDELSGVPLHRVVGVRATASFLVPCLWLGPPL